MREKAIAAILILASVMTMASCSMPGKAETEDRENIEEDDNRTYAEEKIYENIEKITAALAACDFDDLSARCSGTPYKVLNAMPVIKEDEDSESYAYLDNMLLVKNMIAATITSEIDETSYKAAVFDRKYTVDVKFSCKDYNKVAGMRERFLGPADFNMLMQDEESTIDHIITLEFTKQDNHFLLANPDDLIPLYDYNIPALEFMKNHFDMIDTSYMTGPGWDAYTESYYDTNTFEFEIVLDHQAREYIWQYIYAVSKEGDPDWDYIYTSETIVDRYPTAISLSYTQEENFSTGHYYFIIYDVKSEQVYGWEFNVYNTAETRPSSTPGVTTVTESSEET